MEHTIITSWRRLRVQRWGVPNGRPVFLLHGTPGCRLSARPTDDELAALGVHLITYDRPGYGGSDPHPGRTVADAAADVRVIADALGIDTFSVMGRSGGGPHALACAALLPDRVTRVAALVSPAPYDAPGLDWLDGMVELNQTQYGAAVLGPRHLARIIFPQVMAMRSDPQHLLRRLEAQASPEDQTAMSDDTYRAEFIESVGEAVGRSLAGWAGDNMAFTRPWGFEPGWITAPTLLWHFTWDVFVPVSHAHWLANAIRDALLMLSDRGSHMWAARVQRDAVSWLVHGHVPDVA